MNPYQAILRSRFRTLVVRRPLDKWTSICLKSLGVLLTLASWVVISHGAMVKSIFVPTPIMVWSALTNWIASGRLMLDLFASLFRIFSAMVITVAIGIPLGVLMGSYSSINALLSPLTEPLRYLPITALLPLLILWLGIGEYMKIAFLVGGTIFYLVPLVRDAIQDVRNEYVEIGLDIGLRRWEIITKVLWPGALPRIWDGLIVCNGLGWTYVILAEIVNARDGLGYFINIAGRLQRSDEVFAAIITIALIAIVSDRILTYSGKRIFRWYRLAQ